MRDIVVVSPLSNVDRCHTQCSGSSIFLEQTFVCRVDVQLVLKILGEIKRSILNANLKNSRDRFSTS